MEGKVGRKTERSKGYKEERVDDGMVRRKVKWEGRRKGVKGVKRKEWMKVW